MGVRREIPGVIRQGFTAYTQAVEKRLASHNFTQPFQLTEDPRQQDARTTWVEYLNYVYWRRDWHAAAMKAAEPQSCKARDELLRFDASPSSTTSTTGTLEEELSATRAELKTTRQQIRNFKGTKAHQREETAVRRQELRAQWVLGQLPLIETTSSLGREAARNDSNASSGKKRKVRGDHDTLARRQPMRRRQEVGHSGSTLDPEPETGKGSDIVMPDETAAAPTTAGSGLRRSQRRRVGDASKEALLSKPQSEARRTRKTQRQTRTLEDSLGSTASQKPRLRKRTSKV
ncbi:hypothetical protein GP486_006023 [Trichoglossum hirsutum]|uniref:Uncharacterized protein n=1 Tax=Trichoglossum hirsutum TaxID=265104 RepID=A0A9P8L847_9PEZI|nr:hypothetical protein GP486_006023 [Trichoglossum hirsutum]